MPRHDSRHGRRFATVEVTAATLYEAVAQGLNITERVQRRYRVHQRDSHILSMIHSLNERVQRHVPSGDSVVRTLAMIHSLNERVQPRSHHRRRDRSVAFQ